MTGSPPACWQEIESRTFRPSFRFCRREASGFREGEGIENFEFDTVSRFVVALAHQQFYELLHCSGELRTPIQAVEFRFQPDPTAVFRNVALDAASSADLALLT